jgi:hypothetical protein
MQTNPSTEAIVGDTAQSETIGPTAASPERSHVRG